MLTLFHAPRSRSTRMIWLLEELGADYEIRTVNIKRGDGSGAADPANPHPHKQVPALVHDGALITESGAVVLYLTDLFPASRIGRPPGDPQRGEYLTWLFYYQGVVEPLIQMHYGKMMEGNSPLQATYDAMFKRVEDTLRGQPYLLGEEFTGADLLFISMLQFARTLLPPSEVIDAYAERGKRPALRIAMTKDG
jgi:glutathione S-transferase